MRQAAQKPGETPGEGMLPTCAMSLEAAAILLKALGATGLVSPAAEALAKKNPGIQASAKQLAEAGKKMHPTLNQVRGSGGGGRGGPLGGRWCFYCFSACVVW